MLANNSNSNSSNNDDDDDDAEDTGFASNVHSAKKYLPVTHANFPKYKHQMEKIMRDLNWLEIANGSESRPVSGVYYNNRAQQREWDSRDKVLRKYLASTLSPQLQQKFQEYEHGYEYWQMIMREFEQPVQQQQQQQQLPLLLALESAAKSTVAATTTAAVDTDSELFRLIERADSRSTTQQQQRLQSVNISNLKMPSIDNNSNISSSNNNNDKVSRSGNKWNKLQTLTTIAQQENESVEEYISRLIAAAADLEEVGVAVPSDILIAQLLNGLKNNFGKIIADILYENDDFYNFDNNNSSNSSSGGEVQQVTFMRAVRLIKQLNTASDAATVAVAADSKSSSPLLQFEPESKLSSKPVATTAVAATNGDESYFKVLDDLGCCDNSNSRSDYKNSSNNRQITALTAEAAAAVAAQEEALLSDYVMVSATTATTAAAESKTASLPQLQMSSSSSSSPNKAHRIKETFSKSSDDFVNVSSVTSVTTTTTAAAAAAEKSSSHFTTADAKAPFLSSAAAKSSTAATTTAGRGSKGNEVRKPAFEETPYHRGLLNRAGENNCFLNVTIQALWHLGPFRAKLRHFIEHHQTKTTTAAAAVAASDEVGPEADKVGLLDTMCNLFIQYEFADANVLPPTELRLALSALSCRFEIGAIADANEAFDAILQRLHSERSCYCDSGDKCLSHCVFGGLVMEQASCCCCGATSEPTIRRDFILCVQAAEILIEAELVNSRLPISNSSNSSSSGAASLSLPRQQQPQQQQQLNLPFTKAARFQNLLGFNRRTPNATAAIVGSNSNNSSYNQQLQFQSPPSTTTSATTADGASCSFGRILRKCMALSQRSCPSSDFADQTEKRMLESAIGRCPGRANCHLFSLEAPLAIALSVGWTAAREDRAVLARFYSVVALSIQLDDLFHVQQSSSNSNNNSTSSRSSGISSSASSSALLSNRRPMRSASGTWHYGPSYLLRGMVCYYGLHYVSIFQSAATKTTTTTTNTATTAVRYMLFDDQNIRDIGDWQAVQELCVKSLYQPVLLLYELEQ